MVDATYVESSGVAVAGTDIGFNDVIKRDGVAVNLTGKTIKVASIRRMSAPNTVINAALEDIAITSTGTLASGEAEWTLQDTLSTHLTALTPTTPTQTTAFDLQYYIVQDDYYPQVHRFYARRAAD